MEQGKGADGFLAPLVKAASTRSILALAAAAALALAGCGGDGDSDSEGVSAAAAGRAAPENPSSQQPSPGSSSTSSDKDAGAASGGGATTTSRDAAAGGQGAAIAPPKGPREPGITPEQREKAKVTSISLHSPAVLPVANAPAELPAAYTCEGKNSWPALRWQGVPPGTEELVLFAMSLAPVEEKLFFDWAVAGIDPGLESLEAGRLPKGAVTGRNSFGRSDYSICPPAGQAETYFFALYALPERLSARPGFDPRTLRRQVQDLSRDVGLLPVTYARG